MKSAVAALLVIVVVSIVSIIAIEVLASSVDYEVFPGSEWLIGIGFAAMWAVFLCPIFVIAAIAAMWFVRRRRRTTTPQD